MIGIYVIILAFFAASSFVFLDGKIMGFFQNISNRIAKKTGYNNYEVASKAAWAGIILCALIFVIFEAKSLADVLWFLIFDLGALGFAKIIIKKGKEAYRMRGDAVEITPYAEIMSKFRLYLWSFVIYSIYSLTFSSIEKSFVSFELLRWDVLLFVVAYFASCTPLPGAKEKFKLWKWATGKVKVVLSPAPTCAPIR